ncbi:MAG: hypothetical protein KJ767_02460 [Nanoarchaeota archaeon]|nr:hypothetical protein [Nanoarchaeota archaeon]
MASAKNIILIIAIIIIFTLFSVYGIQLFYKEPMYEDYCKESYYPKTTPVRMTEQYTCPATPELDAMIDNCYGSGNAMVNYTYDEYGCLVDFDCSTCNKDYNDAREKWAKNYFIVAVIVGLIAIAVGALLFSLDVVGAGLMGGGALLILVSSMRAWTALGDVVRFVLLGVALVVLIYIAIRLNKGHHAGHNKHHK